MRFVRQVGSWAFLFFVLSFAHANTFGQEKRRNNEYTSKHKHKSGREHRLNPKHKFGRKHKPEHRYFNPENIPEPNPKHTPIHEQVVAPPATPVHHPVPVHNSIHAPFYEFAVGLDGRYDMATISKDTNMDTQGFQMKGLEGLLLFQFMPLEKKIIVPYVGLGLGFIPSYKGASVSYLDRSVNTNLTLKNVAYATLEVGPELIFAYVRWQIFLGYDYGFNGKLARSDSPSNYTYADTKLKIFNRFKLGTRVYFLAARYFDIGLVGNYSFIGTFKDNGSNNVNVYFTKYTLTEMSIGIALRSRLP